MLQRALYNALKLQRRSRVWQLFQRTVCCVLDSTAGVRLELVA
jgi:hypothetical protein